jgi:membrane protein required for colicin V production
MGDFSITVVDVMVVAVVLVSAGYAAWRGLVSETFAIFEWVAATYIALRFTPTFQPLVRGAIATPWLQYATVFLCTFLLVFIPLSIMAHRFAESVRRSEVGPVDRTLGFVFGIGRGLVIVGVAYIAFAALVPMRDHPTTLTRARLFPLILNTSDVLLSLVPNNTTRLERPASREAVQQRRAPAPLAPAPRNPPAQQAAKTYGAQERSALDRLIETTGGN